jgi:hypothetical protein
MMGGFGIKKKVFGVSFVAGGSFYYSCIATTAGEALKI